MSLYIHAKAIQVIIGKSQSTASRLLQAIRDSLAKTPKQKVTIKEFCSYEGLDPNEVQEFIKKNKLL